jgi:hypothetical protein
MVANYTKTMREKANGNITQMNILMIEDLEKRNIIDQKDEEGLLSFVASLNPKPTNIPGNLTALINETTTDSIEALEEIASNSSNVNVITLVGTLKNRVNDIGTNTATLISGNGTGGISVLPPVTIDLSPENNMRFRMGFCMAATIAGGITYGGIGAAVMAGQCILTM